MNIEIAQAVWMEDHAPLSMEELAAAAGLPAGLLREIVDSGAIAPTGGTRSQQRFTGECIAAVQVARRLHADFELDANGIALALTLLQRIHELEAQLGRLRTQLPGG